MTHENTTNTNRTAEELQQENELLKLKIMAQFGGNTNSASDISPELQNEFLKNVLRFEEQFGNGKTIKISSLLNERRFPSATSLNRAEVTSGLSELMELLAEKGIHVDFLAEYPEEVKYSFIVEELLEKEIEDMSGMGFTTNFIYEEFHPNHEYDIKKQTEYFLNEFLSVKPGGFLTTLEDHVVLPD
jgi:hypothetical protein